MKLRKRTCCLYMLFTLCLPLAAQRQGVAHRAPENPEEEPTDNSLFLFDKTDVVFPKLEETDEPYPMTFHYVNRSDRAVTIDKVSLSCGCLKAEYDKAPVPVDGTGNMTVYFNPHGYSGKIYRQVIVYTSLSAEQPTAQLSLSGEVALSKDPWRGYPHRLGVLRAKQSSVHFKMRNRKGKMAEVIACGNSGGRPLSLSAKGLPAYLKFYTVPAVIKPGGEADLVFQVDAALLPEAIEGAISVPVRLEGLDGSAGGSHRTMTVVIQF